MDYDDPPFQKIRQFNWRRLSSRNRLAAVAAVLFAAFGTLALIYAHADTFTVTSEAEDGAITGNAEAKTVEPGSSGGFVSFGTETGTGPLPFPFKTGALTNPMSGRCLDVQDGVASPSTPIRIWDCNSAAAQQWTIQYTKYGASEIKALSQCLTISMPADPTVYTFIYLSACNGSLEQLWIPNGDSGILNYKSLTAGAGDLCLDISGSNPAAGTRVGIWSCSYNDAQKWQIPTDAPRGGAWFEPYTANSNKCLDLPSGSTVAGTQLQVWDCNFQLPQYLAVGLESAPGSRAKLSILGQCLGTKDGGVADGTPVQIDTCTDNPAQDWEYFSQGTGVSFKHRISGKCIDTDSGQVANSAKLVIKTCSPSAPGQVFGSDGNSSNSADSVQSNRAGNDEAGLVR